MNQVKHFIVTGVTACLLSLSHGSAMADNLLIGGCVQPLPVQLVTGDLKKIGPMQKDGWFAPFVRYQNTRGITLIGGANTSEQFMQQVSQTIEEMFATHSVTDSTKQQQLMENLYRYRSVIPLVRQESDLELLSDEQMNELVSSNSVCDIIMTDTGDGQVMEVVEHLLHIITDVGLHYTYPKEWGLNRQSALYRSMKQAVKQGIYDIRSYDGIEDSDERLRVELQEYGYWLITTAWNLQQPYGPDEDEWILKNVDDLKQKLPLAYGLYLTTVRKVLSAPTGSTLEQFN